MEKQIQITKYNATGGGCGLSISKEVYLHEADT